MRTRYQGLHLQYDRNSATRVLSSTAETQKRVRLQNDGTLGRQRPAKERMDPSGARMNDLMDLTCQHYLFPICLHLFFALRHRVLQFSLIFNWSDSNVPVLDII